MKSWWTSVLTSVALFALSGGYAVANLPPISDAGGPYFGNEGDLISLDGSGTSDPDGDPLTYDWDTGDMGALTGSMPSYTYADDGTYAVTLTVTDPNGASSTATTSAQISNVSPMIDSIDDILTADGMVNLLVSFIDPGINDNPWTYAVSWGDDNPADTGSTDTMSPIMLSHMFAGAMVGDMFTGTVIITDKDGGSGATSFTTKIVSSVPEPTTLAMLSLGLAGLGFTRRRMKA